MIDAAAAPVAVLADAHLGGPGGDGRGLLCELASLRPDNCGLLLLLGDLFQVWVGRPRFETEEIRRLVPALEGVLQRGVDSVYIEGNRDFFIADGPYARLFSGVVSEYAFEHAGIRYLAVHGDGLNDRDWRYRFWRRISKNAVSRVAYENMPRRLANRIVHSTEKSLSRTNFEHKKRLPEDAIRRYAERRLAEGHDVLLLGHFHEAVQWSVAGGEVRIFDAWYNRRSLEWLPGV